jgi:HemY protein
MGIAATFLALHIGLRTLSALFDIPRQARRWRLQQRERAILAAMLDALAHLVAGRFVRARKSAEYLVSLEVAVERSGEQLPYAGRLRSMGHLIAAECAHAVQDRELRDLHFQQALEMTTHRDAQDIRDGVQLRAARWAFDDRDARASMDWLDQLAQGAARRMLALRLRFKAARLAGNAGLALETARTLTKHKAFSELAGRSIARGLAIEMIRSAHDPVQLQKVWSSLDSAEQQIPEVALEASNRLLSHDGLPSQARQWLLPLWEAMAQRMDVLTPVLRVRLVRVLESSFGTQGNVPDAPWLARIETVQLNNPRDPVLQYLAGVVCLRLGLWGKATQLLKQSLSLLQDSELKRDAWRALAALAEQRQDAAAATQAYREALNEATRG